MSILSFSGLGGSLTASSFLFILLSGTSVEGANLGFSMSGARLSYYGVDGDPAPYAPSGVGACGQEPLNHGYFVALNSGEFNSNRGVCGLCARVRWNGRCTVGPIVDSCPGCANGLDLSLTMFAELAGGEGAARNKGIIQSSEGATFDVVACPSGRGAQGNHPSGPDPCSGGGSSSSSGTTSWFSSWTSDNSNLVTGSAPPSTGYSSSNNNQQQQQQQQQSSSSSSSRPASTSTSTTSTSSSSATSSTTASASCSVTTILLTGATPTPTVSGVTPSPTVVTAIQTVCGQSTSTRSATATTAVSSTQATQIAELTLLPAPRPQAQPTVIVGTVSSAKSVAASMSAALVLSALASLFFL